MTSNSNLVKWHETEPVLNARAEGQSESEKNTMKGKIPL